MGINMIATNNLSYFNKINWSSLKTHITACCSDGVYIL